MNTFQQGLSALVAQHAGRLPCDALMRAAESLVAVNESPQIEIGLTAQTARERGDVLVETNGVIHVRGTGLAWSKATLEVGKVDFKGAENAVAELALDGGGWRLPTVRELLTLVDYERHDPAIHPVFEAKSDYYWTSTPAAYSPSDYAWIVHFYHGSASWLSRDYRAFVRAVRPSQ